MDTVKRSPTFAFIERPPDTSDEPPDEPEIRPRVHNELPDLDDLRPPTRRDDELRA